MEVHVETLIIITSTARSKLPEFIYNFFRILRL
jgi:hypothetical protein